MLAEHLVRGGWLLHWYHRTKLHACVALACGAASVVVATALAWVAWLAGTAIIGWAVAAINAFLTFASHAVSNLVPLAMYLTYPDKYAAPTWTPDHWATADMKKGWEIEWLPGDAYDTRTAGPLYWALLASVGLAAAVACAWFLTYAFVWGCKASFAGLARGEFTLPMTRVTIANFSWISDAIAFAVIVNLYVVPLANWALGLEPPQQAPSLARIARLEHAWSLQDLKWPLMYFAWRSIPKEFYPYYRRL